MPLTQVQGAMVGPTGFANLSGVTFPATQVPSADANTLDDYEEGTWTPTWLNIGTGTYATQFGRYTKIGRLVTVECFLAISNLGSASGSAVVAGLPFPCTTTVTTSQMWTNNFSGSGQNVVGLIDSTVLLGLFSIPASGGVVGLPMSTLTNTSNIVFNFSYSI